MVLDALPWVLPLSAAILGLCLGWWIGLDPECEERFEKLSAEVADLKRMHRQIERRFQGKLLSFESKLESFRLIQDDLMRRTIDTNVELRAFNKSTHSIHPVPVQGPAAQPDGFTKFLKGNLQSTLDPFNFSDAETTV